MALYIKKRRDPTAEDYVDNKKFTAAMTEYAKLKNEFVSRGEEPPPITDYIGECILKIATGLANKPNFSGYSYKDEFISHAVENCVKVVSKFDPFATTRSGKPNAFGYFTQICYYAFLRVMKKEKMQEDIKLTLLDQADISDLADTESMDGSNSGNIMINTVKNRLDTDHRSIKKVKRKVEVEESIEDFLE